MLCLCQGLATDKKTCVSDYQARAAPRSIANNNSPAAVLVSGSTSALSALSAKAMPAAVHVSAAPMEVSDAVVRCTCTCTTTLCSHLLPWNAHCPTSVVVVVVRREYPRTIPRPRPRMHWSRWLTRRFVNPAASIGNRSTALHCQRQHRETEAGTTAGAAAEGAAAAGAAVAVEVAAVMRSTPVSSATAV